MTNWQALAAGFAFYLILEGIMPFFNPTGFKRILAMTFQLPDQQLRYFGAVMMIVGVVVLYLI